MLTITDQAEQALDAVVAAENAPEGAGIRISQGMAENGQPAMGLALVVAPQPGDSVVEDTNVPVFLAPEVTELLDDKVLDAEMQGDQIAFRLEAQAG